MPVNIVFLLKNVAVAFFFFSILFRKAQFVLVAQKDTYGLTCEIRHLIHLRCRRKMSLFLGYFQNCTKNEKAISEGKLNPDYNSPTTV